jgi:hypothetical protein
VSRPGTRKYERKEDVEWEVLLARVLDLPEAEQLKVQHGLTEALGGRLGKETARAKQTRLRYEALEALRAAAQHLGLPPGQAPTTTEFKKAASEANLPMTFNAVYEAFEKSWETATRIYRGEKVPATAAQRAARRAILGRNRTDHEPLPSLACASSSPRTRRHARLASPTTWTGRARSTMTRLQA